MILEKRGFFDGVKTSKVFYRYWEPKNPKGAIVLLHGLGLNSGFYYKHLGEVLVENDYTVYAMDYRGHGFSQGVRGHLENFEDLLKDVETLMQIVSKKSLHIYIVGEDLGGLLAIGCAEFNPDKIKGIVAVVPTLVPIFKVPALKLLMGKGISKLAPTINILDNIGPEQFIKKSTAIDEETKRTFVYNFTLNFAIELLEGTKKVKERLSILDMPSLFLLSGRDKLMNTQATIDTIQVVRDKTIKVYEKLSHFLLLDGYREVSTDILAWLDNQF